MDPFPCQVVGSKIVGKRTSLQLLRLAAVSFGFLKIVEVSGWTYHYSTTALTWDDAYQWCGMNFTNMVAIQNKEEISFLTQFLPEDGTHYWIGLRKLSKSWVWIGTNKSLTEQEENWAEGEPNNKRNNQDCVEMYVRSAKENGKWNDERCDRNKKALCYLVSCKDSSCNKRGDCVEAVENYTCNCWPGFYGANCENAVSCSALEDPAHGQMNCSDMFGEYRFKSICKFTCEEGFQLQGSNALLCQNSEEWSEPIPICTAVPCKTLQFPEHGEVNCSDGFGESRYKSICNITCKEGFQLQGSSLLLCQKTGEWSAATPTCLAVPCETLQSPANGKLNCWDAFGESSYKSICNVTCEEGFQLEGSSSLWCRSTGQWSDAAPTCLAQNVSPELQRQAHPEAYALPIAGVVLFVAGTLTVNGISYCRRKKNPALLKADKSKDNINTFENPAFEDNDGSPAP